MNDRASETPEPLRASPPRLRLARWGLGGLTVLGAAELGGQLWADSRAPTLEQWQAALPVLAAMGEPGRELLLIAPPWAEPVARHVFGDSWMPLSHVARPDERAFARALEVAVLGQHASPPSWSVLAEQRIGKITLRLLENPRHEPVRFDFLDHLEPTQAGVFSFGRDGERVCPFGSGYRVSNGDLFGHPTFPRERYQCPGGGEWFFVGRTVIEDEHYRPRRCIWAHPSAEGPLIVRYSEVPLGEKIVGHAGLPYFFERDRRGAPVSLSVWVGGTRLGSMSHEDGQGWVEFTVDTRAVAGQRASVEFQIATEKAWRREFCFHAAAY